MRFAIIAAVLAASAGLSGVARAQDMDLMQFADPNGDGKVTLEEFTAFQEQGWGFFSQGADKVQVAGLDPMGKGAFNGIAPDAEGNVTHAAFMAAAPGRFKAADTNGDGTLDKDELGNAMKAPAA